MFGIFGMVAGFGTLAIAAALLFGARRLHKSAGKHTKITKPAGVIFAFVAGLAFLASIAGTWLSGWGDGVGYFAVAGLIICVFIVAVDWLLDSKPDSPAFWAAFVLPFMLVLGVAHIPTVSHQIKQGGNQVTAEMKKAGK